MTWTEIEKLDRLDLWQWVGFKLLGWTATQIRNCAVVYGRPPGREQYEDCPCWVDDPWPVVAELRKRGFRVNIAEVAPGVGEVIIVEHCAKHPKQDRVEATCYYGLAEGMDTCGMALCRAALMAVCTPMRLKETG